MKHTLKFTTWAVLIMLTLPDVDAQQPKQAITNKDCTKPLFLENRALSDSIREYLKYVGTYEIPIIAMQTSGDTTHYFVSAFLATYMIKKNPPIAIVIVNNRETLLYESKESIAKTAPACYNYVLKKYSYLLKVDKVNRKEGRPPSYENKGFNYDPIMGEILITKEGRIFTKHASKIPFIKYD
ncbi:hypothetical protein IC229_01395 [Spirosoma sp. BT702]|uniref:Uncharacterized protein n=1 Tax=Spirosoma profusum TaxID=2771354 RepID=A0A926XTV3_9BACT|nr:hypothetical protein [Spirosoma profusum]MBD2699271.1 hypothetical protein [Spirosoma profusum]